MKLIVAVIAFVAGVHAGESSTSTRTTTRASQQTDPPSSGDVYHGFAGGAAGSCGQKHSDNDLIVAISAASPFKYNEHCGHKVKITNTGGGQSNNGKGKSIYATVADECRKGDGSKCEFNHLDLSSGAFKALTGGNLDPPGQFNIDWEIVE